MSRREELIKGGLNKWATNNCKGILKYVTGTGKTYGALLAIERFVSVYPSEKVLIACPTVDVIENFKREFFKFKKQKALRNCKFICYASLRKEDGNSYSLVVLDEVHHVTTENKMPFFVNVKFRGVLGLSASLTPTQIQMLEPYIPVVDELTLGDVGDEQFIADFTIINFPVQFTEAEQVKYTSLTNSIDYMYATFGKQAWKKIGQRSKLIYSAENKIPAIKHIVSLFEDKYGIIFSLNKDFTERIADELGEQCVAIHSGHSKKQRAKRLRIFSDGRTKVRQVSVPKIFDEGVTLPRLEYGILAARYAKERQQIQTLGRLLRRDLVGKHSIAFRLYVEGSKEEQWVETSQEGFKVLNITNYVDLEELIIEIREESILKSQN